MIKIIFVSSIILVFLYGVFIAIYIDKAFSKVHNRLNNTEKLIYKIGAWPAGQELPEHIKEITK